MTQFSVRLGCVSSSSFQEVHNYKGEDLPILLKFALTSLEGDQSGAILVLAKVLAGMDGCRTAREGVLLDSARKFLKGTNP